MKIEVICQPNNLASLLKIDLIDYEASIKLAFDKIEQNQVLSSWKDAQTSNLLNKGMTHYMDVPVNGCFKDIRKTKVADHQTSLSRIWSIGGKNGWYYSNWLWEIRGFIDQLNGGVGMRRGRRSDTDILAGDTLDFWRVLVANKDKSHNLPS
jgi:hypothetical protein